MRNNTVERVLDGEWLRRAGEMLVQATKDLFEDNGPQWAAAIAYYSLLSIFPLLLAAASIAAFFVEPQGAVDRATRLMGEFLPGGEARIADIVIEAIDARGTVSLLSIGALLWSGSRVFGAATRALNIAFDVDETYGFLKRTLVELVMLVSIGTLFIITLASRFLIRWLWDRLEILPPGQDIIFQIAMEAIPPLLLLLTFFLVYRFVPRRKVNSWAAFWGALLATALFSIARPLFLTYYQRFANYNLIYGSLAIFAMLVIWAWIVSLIVLFGGEVVSHIQDMLIEGQPAEEVERRHQRRSPSRLKDSQ